jgi:SPP1 gp7 family putative phage head morphogenesis protein
MSDDGEILLTREAEAIRREIRRLVWRYGRNSTALAHAVQQLIDAKTARLAEAFRVGQMQQYATAAREVLESLPAATRPPIAPPRRPPNVIYPQAQRAVDWVASRVPYLADEFEAIDQDARAVGFTVARVQTLRAVQDVRAAIRDDIAEGGTLREFRSRIGRAVDEGALSNAETEALYRTHTARAYSAGQIAVLQSPAVRDQFPYLMYSATHDSRVRKDHLAMERHGLQGTAVYRADDPVWQVFYPPWGWNCRCVVIPIDVATAAEEGVEEAIEWEASGQPPAEPEFVPWPPFELPPGWVPTGARPRAVG